MNPPSVLLVEDNMDNLDLVKDALSLRAGVELLSATSGAQALDQVRWYRPDLVLLDIHLPDMDGEEVIARLAADPQTASTPVVVVSADATAEQRLRARHLPVAAFLTKPIDLRHLLIVVGATGPRTPRHKGHGDGA